MLKGKDLQLDDEYGLKETHEKLLKLLIDIDRVCRENDIKYSLCAGTLLGAIRHKGFIPWDDDADICFEREQYEKFLKIYKEKRNPEYGISTALNECTYTITAAYVGPSNYTIGTEDQEPWVSMFVFDSVPKNAILASIKVFIIKTLMGMMGKPPMYKRFRLKTRILFTITSIMGMPFKKDFIRRMHRVVSKWSNDKNYPCITRYNIFLKPILKAKYPKEILEDYIDVAFEGHKFMSMAGHHEFLTLEYGDYMTPPPKKERKASHDFR